MLDGRLSPRCLSGLPLCAHMVTVLGLALSTIELPACTIITSVSRGHVLMGNNEDFTKRGAIWFVP